MEYAHPLYTPDSVAAQATAPRDRHRPDRLRRRLPRLGVPRGRRALRPRRRRAARRIGGRAETGASDGRRQPPGATGIYATTITHTRRTPFARRFTHRSHTWVVDLDDLPDHGLLGRFEARDHLGDPGRTIRDNLEAFLADHGVTLDGGRVLMAAHPRAFGHCFNPISVFWCRDRRGVPVATVVEVHNTYGDRHAYLVHPDEHGRATHTQGDVRVAVPRHRRPLRARRTGAGRPAAAGDHAAHRRRRALLRVADRAPAPTPARGERHPRRCAARC